MMKFYQIKIKDMYEQDSESLKTIYKTYDQARNKLFDMAFNDTSSTILIPEFFIRDYDGTEALIVELEVAEDDQ